MKDGRESILERIRRSTPLSPSAHRLLMIGAKEDHSLREFIDVVTCDTVLTAHVIRVANSAAYKPKQEVTTIFTAVSMLGERTVVSMALDLCSKGLFQSPLEGYCGKPGGLWRHSLLTAFAAKDIARKANSPLDEGMAFTAGILHDIGKAALSPFLKDNLEKLLESVDKGGEASYLDSERAIAGIDHCEAGAALALQWKLPEQYVAAIQFHHEPSKAPAQHAGLTYAVHLGDIISMMIGIADGSDGMLYKMDPGYAERFTIGPHDIESIMSATLAAFKKAQDSMGRA